MEITDKNLNRILTYCEKISEFEKENIKLKDWLQRMIYRFGIRIFESNIPELNQRGIEIKFNVFVFSHPLIFQQFENLEGDNNYFIKINAGLNNAYTLIQFLSVLSQIFSGINFIFISESPLLLKDEVIFNIYNVANIIEYVKFSEVNDIMTGFKILNIDAEGIYANNLSFINQNVLRMLEKNSVSGRVFDLHINSENIKDGLKVMMEKVISITNI